MTCKIDHSSEGLPEALCRVCHPRPDWTPVKTVFIDPVLAEQKRRREEDRQRQKAKSLDALKRSIAEHEAAGEYYDRKLKRWLPVDMK